jgi:hypothetical protein
MSNSGRERRTMSNLDDEGLGDAAFIEESEESDVSEIISGDIETEKGA